MCDPFCMNFPIHFFASGATWTTWHAKDALHNEDWQGVPEMSKPKPLSMYANDICYTAERGTTGQQMGLKLRDCVLGRL